MKKKNVIAYLHTHYDPEWYRSKAEFDIRLVEIFDDVLLNLQKNKIPSFYFDGQVYALLNYLKFRPQKKNLIKRFIKEKKLFIGPFFVSGDSFLVCGISLLKNLQYGINFAQKFGEDEFIGYLADIFGISKSIFKALEIFKIKRAVIWRGAGDIPSDFISNNITTTRLVYGYYQDISTSFDKILDKIAEFSADTLLLPIGADHLALPEKIDLSSNKYNIKLGSPFEYNPRPRGRYDGEFLDNSKTFILSGVYSARIPIKTENARLEWELFRKAEVFDFITGGKYKAEIDLTCLELIKNHAHDSIYGCSLDEVNNTVKERQAVVLHSTKAILSNLKRDFKNKNLISNSNEKIAVFNFSQFEQSGAVKIISDKKINGAQKISKFNAVCEEIWTDIRKNPMTEDFHTFYEYLIETDFIPPFSYKNFKIELPEKKCIVGKDFIENSNLKLFILDNKIFVLDKINNALHSDFIELNSIKDFGDSYNFAPCGENDILKFKHSKILSKGPVKYSLRLVFEENIKLDFSLLNNSEFFEIEVNFKNKRKNRRLQIAFNTGSPVYKTLAKDPIGTISRKHDPDYSLMDFMPAVNKNELKTNTYSNSGYIKANGVTLLSEGLNEYEVSKNYIKLTLLRSIGIISNPKNKARNVPAGPPIECPGMQCLGEVSLRLGFGFFDNQDLQYEKFMNPFVGILGDFKIKNKTYLKTPSNSNFCGIIEIEGKNAPCFTEKSGDKDEF